MIETDIAAVEPPSFEETLRSDTENVARRTLRHKFGRLSNRRIIATLRSCGDAPQQPDHVLLERWFAAYDSALRRLRSSRPS